jgi:hypothetical protein
VRAIVQIATTVILYSVLGPVAVAAGFIGAAATVAAGVAAAAASASIVTGLSGGNLGQILRAGAIAGATAFAFNVVGSATNAVAGEGFDLSAPHMQPGLDTPGAYAFNVAGHALVGCGASVASGGSCQSGALSGAVTAGAGPLINGQRYEVALVENAVLGGVASVAGGGKFANGAITGAFGYMFNAAARECVPFGCRGRVDGENGGGGGIPDSAGGTSGAVRVITPQGEATQATDASSVRALIDVLNGSPVYRAGEFGIQNTGNAQYWSLQNPATTPNYAGQMGMLGSSAPSFDWIMRGSVTPGSTVVTRPAPAFGANGEVQ